MAAALFRAFLWHLTKFMHATFVVAYLLIASKVYSHSNRYVPFCFVICGKSCLKRARFAW